MRSCASLVVALLAAVPAAAHFNMLLPDKASVRKGETVTLTYQWGHPFEHELFDAPAPDSLFVISPDGKSTDLTRQLKKKTQSAGSKEVTVYQLQYTPQVRGDHVFVLRTAAIWMAEEGEFLVDVVKTVLHVQAQKGWEAPASPDFEMEPLTRPYGLQPGMVFQARITAGPAMQPGSGLPSGPLAGALVEIERYNARRPDPLPPDEQITRTARTDPNGVVTTTLTDPGWWCLTAATPGVPRRHEGRQRPVRRRCTLWVFVDDRPAGK